jgi:hypothetical protein
MSTAADAIVALAALIALLCLFYGPWQSLCIDLSRQFIFERRDRLFDMALAGRIEFDSEAYRATRRALNGMIRFAHELTWPDMVVAFYFIQKAKPKVPRWRDTLVSLPPDVRNEIERLVKECSATLTGMMALKSIFVAPIVVILFIVLACTTGVNWLVGCIANQEKFEPLNETIQKSSAEFAENETACAA